MSASTPVGVTGTLELLRKLGPVSDEIVLVGGQALNFWAEQYRQLAPEFSGAPPFTSKDVDFFGDVRHARRVAEALHGKCLVPDGNHHATPNTAKVTANVDGEDWTIDFLGSLAGVTDSILPTSIQVAVKDVTFRVLPPFICLKSRVANVVTLERRSPQALTQLRAAIVCMREFLAESLEQAPRALFFPMVERLFWFAQERHALAVHCDPAIAVDVFALPPEKLLPPIFKSRRLPQMRELLKRKRDKHARLAVRP